MGDVGAEPCTGSNMDGALRFRLMLAEAAKPRPPWIAAPRSVEDVAEEVRETTTSRLSSTITIRAHIASMSYSG